MHLLANQFTFKDKDESSLDISSLQYIGYLEMLLKNMKDEINSEREHFFKRLTDKNDYFKTLAEIEIGYLFKDSIICSSICSLNLKVKRSSRSSPETIDLRICSS